MHGPYLIVSSTTCMHALVFKKEKENMHACSLFVGTQHRAGRRKFYFSTAITRPAREESAREEQQFQNAATAAWLPYCEVLK